MTRICKVLNRKLLISITHEKEHIIHFLIIVISTKVQGSLVITKGKFTSGVCLFSLFLWLQRLKELKKRVWISKVRNKQNM
ncbi:hypothetical protein ADS77_03360 [Pseudoalteromonas porphyrae]|uniref:Uncharacterized protein n=1 Tax=Pseudoalteromonas porphyrae TaxID=187330 RepID=A0A0N0M1P0_9GAMM|nr:hypothetical protein ADS77_03360 [Pseudoalteromonas porphyrae]